MIAKPNIVVLPGMDGTGELLADFCEQLGRDCDVRLIAYPVDRKMGYAELTEFVEARLPDHDFAIVGESFSGPIAIEIASAHRRARALILASSFARAPFGRQLRFPLRLFNHRLIPSGLMIAALLSGHGERALEERLRRVLSNLPPDVIRRRASEVLCVDARESLRKVACPVMYLRGRADRLLGRRAAEDIVLNQPDCRVVEMDAPHMLLETNSRIAASRIATFFAAAVAGA